MAVNKVILLGRLGKDPEVRTLENGVMVANFTLATSESYKDKVTGEKKETTEWHTVSLWRGLAETASKYLHKGDEAYVEGKLKTRSYEKDGVTRRVTEIIGDSLNLIGGRKANVSAQASQPSGNQSDTDLPF